MAIKSARCVCGERDTETEQRQQPASTKLRVFSVSNAYLSDPKMHTFMQQNDE